MTLLARLKWTQDQRTLRHHLAAGEATGIPAHSLETSTPGQIIPGFSTYDLLDTWYGKIPPLPRQFPRIKKSASQAVERTPCLSTLPLTIITCTSIFDLAAGNASILHPWPNPLFTSSHSPSCTNPSPHVTTPVASAELAKSWHSILYRRAVRKEENQMGLASRVSGLGLDDYKGAAMDGLNMTASRAWRSQSSPPTLLLLHHNWNDLSIFLKNLGYREWEIIHGFQPNGGRGIVRPVAFHGFRWGRYNSSLVFLPWVLYPQHQTKPNESSRTFLPDWFNLRILAGSQHEASKYMGRTKYNSWYRVTLARKKQIRSRDG